MSIFNNKRLPASTFKLDVDRMRRGWYSDKYFLNIVTMLTELAKRGYRFSGKSPRLDELGAGLRNVDTGDLHVEMQWFTRRKPFSVVVGIDKCLAMLKDCTGYFDDQGHWVPTYDQLEVLAVQDGFMAPYGGDPSHVTPVLKVRGRYRDFAMLETPTLGALTRATRVATNVYDVLQAAGGKDVLFFPARFDAHEIQASDGYAYYVAVHLFNRNFNHRVPSLVSTDEQGDWWGGAGGGTVAHAAIACFLGDTAETVLAFAATLPADIPRIALVDFNNDSVDDSLKTIQAMFARYRELMDSGRAEEAKRYVLYGVRLDTSGNMVDQSIMPLGDPKLDRGVNPRLVFHVRAAIDRAYETWDLPFEWLSRAREYCKNVKITVTGGFTPEKIRYFEEYQVPADVYGVGSYLFSNCSEHGTNNDFTADIVRVQVEGTWYDLAKTGRAPAENPALAPIDWNEI